MLTILQCFDNSVCVINRFCFESSESETNMREGEEEGSKGIGQGEE
jgi:hypothetical protein